MKIWIKTHKVKSFFLVAFIAILLWVGGFYALDALRIKDPHDPRWTAEDFKFEDYHDLEDSKQFMTVALGKAFPLGTDRREIDRILVKKMERTSIKKKMTTLATALCILNTAAFLIFLDGLLFFTTIKMTLVTV